MIIYSKPQESPLSKKVQGYSIIGMDTGIDTMPITYSPITGGMESQKDELVETTEYHQGVPYPVKRPRKSK